MKIMREMLKRRQFIFGKQNINRHQPYVDDVVINISDEDAVMKFAPTKKQVIDAVTNNDFDDTIYNISENDIEFVDTFIYYVKTQLLPEEPQEPTVKAVVGGNDGPNDGPYAYHVGYMYRIIGGTMTLSGGEVDQMADPNTFLLFPGPILIHEGKPAKLSLTTEAINPAEYFPYLSNNIQFIPMEIGLALQIKNGNLGNYIGIVAMVLGFDIEATEDEPLIPEAILPHIGDTVEVTSDTMKYIEHKALIGVPAKDK